MRKIWSVVAEIFSFYYFEVIFNWRSSSVWGFLILFCSLSLSLKFKENAISGCWDNQLLIFWGHLPLEVLFVSSIFDFGLLKFKIRGRSDQWLLKYSTFNILRSSSIGRRLPFKHLWFWFSPLSLSLKFDVYPISGCWDIQLLIFWGLLPLVVVFLSSFWF